MLYLKKIIPFMLVLWLMPAMLVAQNTGQQQQSREELERRKKELQREIDEANEQLKETKKSTKESLGQLRALRDKITLRSRLINNINEEINFINGDINTAARDVKTLQKDLDTLKAQYAQLVIYAYKNRSSYDMLNFVFSAENFNDAVKRFQYLKQYREYRRRLSGGEARYLGQTPQVYSAMITGRPASAIGKSPRRPRRPRSRRAARMTGEPSGAPRP